MMSPDELSDEMVRYVLSIQEAINSLNKAQGILENQSLAQHIMDMRPDETEEENVQLVWWYLLSQIRLKTATSLLEKVLDYRGKILQCPSPKQN